MKFVASFAVAALISVFFWAQRADVQTVLEPFGKLTLGGGVQNEEGEPRGHGNDGRGESRARGMINFLGVLPAWGNFGFEGYGQFEGGTGRYRLSTGLGPVYDFGFGKAGVFINYQHRNLRSAHFVWVQPSVSLYLDPFNFNLWYQHPLTSPQTDKRTLSSETECISTVCFTSTETRKITEYGVNRLQATASYYVPWDIAPFLRKDNLELTLGVQVNTFGGVGHEKLTGVGVGPVAGVAFMPWQNVEVNLFKATGDNRGRFDVQSGLSFYFSPSNAPSLKMLRRKYLEVGPGSVGAVASTGGELIISPCLTCT